MCTKNVPGITPSVTGFWNTLSGVLTRSRPPFVSEVPLFAVLLFRGSNTYKKQLSKNWNIGTFQTLLLGNTRVKVFQKALSSGKFLEHFWYIDVWCRGLMAVSLRFDTHHIKGSRMSKAKFMVRFLVATLFMATSPTNTALADIFGSGADQFEIEFVMIPGDAGDLGSWPAGDGFTFTGVNRDDYRMGTFEITNDQWNKFKNNLGVPVTGTPTFAYDKEGYWPSPTVAATQLSWYEIAQFVNWLNTSTGHHAAYRFVGVQGTNTYTYQTWDPSEAVSGSNLYRHRDAHYFIPTEAEWFKAAYWNGSDVQNYANASPDDLIAGLPNHTLWNYGQASLGQPWDVRSGVEELNGTYDMMGNVGEWMEGPYSNSDTEAASNRATRGGSYFFDVWLSSSERIYTDPAQDNNIDIGFRIAANVPEPSSIVLAIGAFTILTRRR